MGGDEQGSRTRVGRGLLFVDARRMLDTACHRISGRHNNRGQSVPETVGDYFSAVVDGRALRFERSIHLFGPPLSFSQSSKVSMSIRPSGNDNDATRSGLRKTIDFAPTASPS